MHAAPGLLGVAPEQLFPYLGHGRARPQSRHEDATAGYFEEPTQTREMPNGRYDDFKSGRVKPIPAEVIALLRATEAGS